MASNKAHPEFSHNGITSGQKVGVFHYPELHCPACGVRTSCLPLGLDDLAMQDFDALFGAPRRLARREVLFRPGDPFLALHAIRVGTLKSVVLAEDGRAQITGYHMAGDVVGIDGIGHEHHTCEAVALEDSEVCVLPLSRLHELTPRQPAVLTNLVQLISRDLRRSQDLVLLLGSMRAEERLATFLLNLAHRNRMRGYSASEFVLRMTREEIASFLGLKLETVSRILSRLHGEGLIQVHGRSVKLVDVGTLRRVAGHSC